MIINEMIQQHTKKTYIQPQIKVIGLDTAISIMLESEPPYGPGEDLSLNATNSFDKNLFRK